MEEGLCETFSDDYTAIQVRDAIIDCFLSAHRDALEELKEYGDLGSEMGFDDLKKLDIKFLVMSKFKEIGADFENPRKEDLVKVIGVLAEYAKNFRNKEVIEGNYSKMLGMIDKIKE